MSSSVCFFIFFPPHVNARTIHTRVLESHPSRVSSTGMSLSAGSSPLHSPKITPHTSPAPRRRSHTPNPNPANYMVPTTAAEQGGATHIIQKETVGGTTYFYTDNTPAPMAGMVQSKDLSLSSSYDYDICDGTKITAMCYVRCFQRTISTHKQHLMWRTCSPKPTLRPSLWPTSSDRYSALSFFYACTCRYPEHTPNPVTPLIILLRKRFTPINQEPTVHLTAASRLSLK